MIVVTLAIAAHSTNMPVTYHHAAQIQHAVLGLPSLPRVESFTMDERNQFNSNMQLPGAKAGMHRNLSRLQADKNKSNPN